MTSWTPSDAEVAQVGDRTLITVTGPTLVEAARRSINTVERTYPVYGPRSQEDIEIDGEVDLDVDVVVLTIIKTVDILTNRMIYTAQMTLPTPRPAS